MDKEPRLSYRKGRPKPFLVRFYDKENKRTSRAFAARMDAIQFMQEFGGESFNSQYDIATDEKDAVMQIKRACCARGVKFADLTENFVSLVRNLPERDYQLGPLYEMFLADAQARNLRPSTYDYYKYKLSLFVKFFGEHTKISVITPEMIERFIYSNKSHACNRRCASAFCTFLIRNRILKENPMKNVIVRKVRRHFKIPPILTVAQTEEMLKEIPESFVPAFVLMTFFGLRPQEVICEKNKALLQLSDIDLNSRIIRVRDETAKMGNSRIICNVPDNAWKWLEKYLPQSGEIFPYSYNSYLRIRKMCSIHFENDILRHSFASYGYHKIGLEKTVEIMGHESGFEVYKSHYKAMVRPDEAEKFFNILPSIRDDLPKRPPLKVGMPESGLSGEIRANLIYLFPDKAKEIIARTTQNSYRKHKE